MILKNGNSRMCFFGDSITAHGWWIAEIAEHLIKNRKDQIKILPFNCGVPGDSASNALNRIYCDCGHFFPETVVVMFGMNDIGRDLYSGRDHNEENSVKRKERLKTYQKSINEIVDKLNEIGSKVILCTPTPYDIWQQSPNENLKECNVGLAACRDILFDIAKKYRLQTVDFYTELTEFILKHPDKQIIGEDRVHPNSYGHHLMAQIFMKETGMISERDYNEFVLEDERNKERFQIEQILRNMSFVDWCLNYDVLDEWQPAVQKTLKKLEVAKSWNNNDVDSMIEAYHKHKNNQQRLLDRLIQITVSLYQS